MTHTTLSSDSSRTRRLALAGVFTALAIVGSFLSFPVAGSKCAPVQHIINILAAVTLGPWYSVGIAFCASLLRNLLGLGSMMAFPGSMVGALCCGLVYSICHKLSLTCLAEALGTGILGGLAAYPELKNIAQVEHSRHRSFDNFIVNTLGSLAAYCFFPKKPTIAVQRTVDRQLTLF